MGYSPSAVASLELVAVMVSQSTHPETGLNLSGSMESFHQKRKLGVGYQHWGEGEHW
jgi:hypothetical protein